MPAISLDGNTVLAWGRNRKPNVTLLVNFIDEGASFTVPPVVTLAPEYQPQQVNNVETIKSLTNVDVEFHSFNTANDYFVHWMAVGPGAINREPARKKLQELKSQVAQLKSALGK